MSYYIQDDLIVVETSDNKLMLFIKGGDNNVSSSESNKRCSDLHLQGVFENEDDFINEIDLYLADAFAGGSWQVNSLRNKSFSTFFEHDYLVLSKFKTALKRRVETSWSLKDVTLDNIHKFQNALFSVIDNKKSSILKNQDGRTIYGLGFIWSYDKDKTAEELGLKRLEVRKRDANKYIGYGSLITKYKDCSDIELLNDIEFIKSFIKFQKDYDGIISLLLKMEVSQIIRDYDYEKFKVIFTNSFIVKRLLDSFDIKQLLRLYPFCFEQLVSDSSFNDEVNKLIENTTCNYDKGRYEENKKLIFDANYSSLKDEFDELINMQLTSAKDNFIDAWNNIVDFCFYKQTNTKIPKLLEDIKSYIKTNTFKVEDCLFSEKKFEKDEKYISIGSEFKRLPSHHFNQYKKNQKAVVEAVKYLINEHSNLFIENGKKEIVEHLCDYFNLALPVQVKDTNTSNKTKKQSLSTPSLF